MSGTDPFTKLELKLLDKLKGAPRTDSQACLGHYLLKLAQLDGYLASLHDIHLGCLRANGDAGN